MKRIFFVIGCVVLAVLVKGLSEGGRRYFLDSPVSDARDVVGVWRQSDSTMVRGFTGDGSTWLEESGSDTQPAAERQWGTYRLLERGKMEIRMDGEAPSEWAATTRNDTLQLKSADGRVVEYVNTAIERDSSPPGASGDDDNE